MKSLVLLFILPAIAYGALIFGGADTAKRCGEVLVNGTVKDTVPDTDNCSQYYVCSNWFQSRMKCKIGKHFSATEKKCVDPCAAACDPDLVCTTTSAPETPTETAAPTATADATESSEGNVTVAESTEKESETSGAGSAGTDAPAIVTDTPATATSAPATDAAAEDNTPATDKAATSDEPVTSEDTAAGTSDESAETSTAFWQTIAKHFNKPPSTIPGFTVPAAE